MQTTDHRRREDAERDERSELKEQTDQDGQRVGLKVKHDDIALLPRTREVYFVGKGRDRIYRRSAMGRDASRSAEHAACPAEYGLRRARPSVGHGFYARALGEGHDDP
jgi:hypothetical protein